MWTEVRNHERSDRRLHLLLQVAGCAQSICARLHLRPPSSSATSSQLWLRCARHSRCRLLLEVIGRTQSVGACL